MSRPGVQRALRAPLVVAAAQPACTPGDVARNVLEHAGAVRRAGARVVVFPELSLTGYELDAEAVAPQDPRLAPIVEACAQRGAIALAGAPVQEQGRRHIAALRIDGAGVAVAYRKAHLGGEEAEHFSPGAGPAVLAVDGWRLGLAICKDTGVTAHTEATARLGIDLYVAGLVHRPDEIGQQDARGRRIAAACRGYVAFASCAGPAGAGYEETAGQSAVWAADGRELARAGAAPGDLARARLT